MRTVHCQFMASLYWQCCHCPGRTSLWMGPKFASNWQNRPESSLLSGVNGQSLIEEIIQLWKSSTWLGQDIDED